MKIRYSTSGNWYKGNTHIHSTASDGGKTFSEIAEIYAGEGYDFLFRTDHWVASDTAGDNETYPLLWLDGLELDGHDEEDNYFHVVCLGRFETVNRKDGFLNTFKAIKEQGGLTILAHPHWSGNSMQDCLEKECDGIEVYNHVCRFLNGKSDGVVHWDAALMQNTDTLAFAADDAHLKHDHEGHNGGWIVVNAPECTQESIMDSIRQGNFYSSCGPEFHSISFDGTSLKVESSPVQFVRLVGNGPRGDRVATDSSQLIESCSFEIRSDWKYFYLELEDVNGKKAWTNSLFSPELK